MIDDFSYVKSSFVFADTHRLAYNGWATAMLGWQIVAGGMFARIFGHTFTAVRMSTFVASFFTVWLLHAVCVRCGLSRVHAVVGALALGLSPVFLPMSVSFMTDVNGLLGILLCLYCCLRAVDAESDTAVMGWLIGASLLGAMGATARQIAWMAPLVMAPSAAWLLRKRRGVLPASVALWLLSAAAMLWSMRWFARQPLSVPEGLIQGAVNAGALRELLGNMTAALLCLLLLLLPLLAAWSAVRSGWKKSALLLAASMPVTFAARFLTHHVTEKGWAPWTGDVLDKIGMLDFANAWFLGVGPSSVPSWLRIVLSFAVAAATLYFVAAVRTRSATTATSDTRSIRWRTLLTLTLPFLLAYLALLAPRAAWGIVIDRYLLPPLALGMLFLLRLYQERVGSRLPAVTYVLLAVYAGFAVAGTHDWVAAKRARLAAVQRLESAGESPQRIEAGYELDGVTQIDLTGAVIDPRVQYPPSIVTATKYPSDLPAACREIYNPHTPALQPRYFLSASAAITITDSGRPCLLPSQHATELFRAWMPPFQRRIYILERPAGR